MKLLLKPIFSLVMEVTYLFSVPKHSRVNDMRVIDDFDHLKGYIKDLNRHWTYVYDKWYGLLNHINVPTDAVRIKQGDCDDYASHVYQVGKKFNPYLLTYFPTNISKAHTVTVLRYSGQFVLVNWGRITFHDTVESIYENLEKYAKSKLISKHWAKYDYEKGKFHTVKKPNL